MRKITSTSNEEIKLLTKLQDSKYRKQQNKFIAEGIRTCSTLINSKIIPIQIYCTQKIQDEAFELCKDQKKITIVSDEVIKKISSSTTPSGIVCLFDIPQAASAKLNSGIVLANISDPGNMGTLIRSAAAMKVKTVVVIDGVDPWNPKTIQSSAGTIGQVNIFQMSWQELVNLKKDLKLCALIVKGGKKYSQLDLQNSLLVVGNESTGIPEQWIEQCEQKLTISMPGNVESLNAAVAGSIALYLAFIKD